MTMHRYKFSAGDRREPCRDLQDGEPIVVLFDEAVDLGEAIVVLVERHVPWMAGDLLDRSWVDDDEFGTGADLGCWDVSGPDDNFFASLRYVGVEVPRCVETLEMVF